MRTHVYVLLLCLALCFAPRQHKRKGKGKALEPDIRSFASWKFDAVDEYHLTEEDDEQSVMEMLRSARTPRVLKNVPSVRSWAALGKWTPAYFREHVPAFANVLYGSRWGSHFMYVDTTRPMLKDAVPHVTWKQPYHVNESVAGSRFLAEPPHEFMYMSRQVEHIAPEHLPNLIDDVLPRPLQPPDSQATIKVWFSPLNVTAHLHYDYSDNLFTQIYGTKRFTIFPPTEMFNLYMFPSLHPATRQSRVNVDAADVATFPRFVDAAPQGRTVVLSPGDVLFLPALWYHQVQGGGQFSISTAMFLPTFHKHIVKRAFGVNVPLGFESNAQKDTGLWMFLDMVISTALDLSCKEGCPEVGDERGAVARAFIGDVIKTRWRASHLRVDPVLGDAHEYFAVDKDQRERFCSKKDRLPHLKNSFLENTLRQSATEVGNIFAELPPGLREILLTDYLEEGVRALKGLEHVRNFLFDCFLEPRFRVL